MACPGLKIFFGNSELSDVFVTNNGITIPAHRVILSSASQLFREFFKDNPNAQIVDVNGVNDNISKLIEYIYTGKLDITKDELGEYLKYSQSYGIYSLKRDLLYALDYTKEDDIYIAFELIENHPELNKDVVKAIQNLSQEDLSIFLEKVHEHSMTRWMPRSLMHDLAVDLKRRFGRIPHNGTTVLTEWNMYNNHKTSVYLSK